MKWLKGRERGFTLVELLVAIPIAGLILAAASGVIFQLLKTNDINADTLAIRQVQTAGDWVSRDGIQTQVTSGISSGSGLPFTLTWSYWDTGASPPVNETHVVTYSLVDMGSGDMKRLQRHEVVTDAFGAVVSDTTITVAEFVDAGATSCEWVIDPSYPDRLTTFAFTVTATVGDKTQSRLYQVRPRALG